MYGVAYSADGLLGVHHSGSGDLGRGDAVGAGRELPAQRRVLVLTSAARRLRRATLLIEGFAEFPITR